MNIFAFSIYGEAPKYNLGAIANARLIKKMGVNWGSVFYYDNSVPLETIEKLTESGAITKRRGGDWHENGMFWRFKACRDFDFERVLIRDVDSRITERELNAVQSWIDSGKTFHIMRDHPNHRTPMLGGMWGASHKIKEFDYIWKFESRYGNAIGEDQRFLRDNLYPLAKRDALIHDSFFRFEKTSCAFQLPRVNFEYVGESVDEFENFDYSLRYKIDQIENNFFRKILLKRPQIKL